jgi:fumarate reductase subunit D
MTRLNNLRAAAGQPLFWAKLIHRVSGLVLAFFLPIHFWALSHALDGAAALSRVMRISDNSLYKASEWALVLLLALHMTGGLRILWMEKLDISASLKDALAWCVGISFLIAMIFAFNRFF